MDAVMVARRTSFIVMTPPCFSITARYRGTAQVPRPVLLPDVSGSPKSGQRGPFRLSNRGGTPGHPPRTCSPTEPGGPHRPVPFVTAGRGPHAQVLAPALCL